ncbi:hypothetical protein [Candidatus Agathobaculum pullicola]|uniref:hypothetical protein n=1 Tax=Candidatus Agathobaculum pullicola TaxID=2838426 RepID=UPI003F9007E4
MQLILTQSNRYRLYVHYCYLMGLSQKAKHHISPFLQPCGWSCNITAQTRLLGCGELETAEQVAQLIVRTQGQIEAIENPRSILYNKLRWCNDPEEQKTLKDQWDGCTQQLSQLRKDRKNAQIILDQTPEHCRRVGGELALRQGVEPMEKTKR